MVKNIFIFLLASMFAICLVLLFSSLKDMKDFINEQKKRENYHAQVNERCQELYDELQTKYARDVLLQEADSIGK